MLVYNITITEGDILNFMHKFNPYKGVGPDGISPFVLRNVGSLSHPLRLIFQASIRTGTIPSDWKCANIGALHKKGSKQLPNNYRPVSLTSQVAKLLERITLAKLLNYCERHRIFTCEQHGFRSRCSCLTNLIESLNDWTSTYDAPASDTDVIYTDFQTAFDQVPIRRLLYKLSQYGIRGKVLRWLTTFLVGREQRVVLEGIPSPWCAVTSGVPQDTILGPIMFLFFVNDIPEKVSTNVKLFADDCKLYNRIRNRDDCAALQDDLDSLAAWSRDWLLRFSKEKCIALCIKRNSMCH